MVKKLLHFPKWFIVYHLFEIPRLKESGKRWGAFQTYLSLAFFFIALYFPFMPEEGMPMTTWNWVAIGFLSFGGLLIVYSFYLFVRYSLKASIDNPATKDDITKIESAINKNGKQTNILLLAVAKKLGVDTDLLIKEMEKIENGESEYKSK